MAAFFIGVCVQYFVEASAMAVRRVKKSDLKRIAKATGATYLTSLTDMEGKVYFSLRSCARKPKLY